MSDKKDEKEGPFEIRTTNMSSSASRKHHSFGGANSYTNAIAEEGPLLEPPQRKYECVQYETCLDLAATLNWASFTCKNCCGEVSESLQWRAHQIRRRDALAQAICDLPRLSAISNPAANSDSVHARAAAKPVVSDTDDTGS